MGDISEFQIGQTVELQDGRTAIVRYVGNTHFAAGDWIGVELDDASGKNNGEVQGTKYFDCNPNHGMFVRPTVVVVVEQPTPKPPRRIAGSANGEAARSRPVSMVAAGVKRHSILSTASSKRQSISAASSTPGPRGIAPRSVVSPSKSPTKQLMSTTASSNSSSRSLASMSAVKPGAAATKRTSTMGSRQSMAPPASTITRGTRQSAVGGAASGLRPAVTAPVRRSGSRLSTLQQNTGRAGSISASSQASSRSGYESPAEDLKSEAQSPPLDDSIPQEVMRKTSGVSASSGSVFSAGRDARSPPVVVSKGEDPLPTTPRPPTSNVFTREIEDLKTKLKLMEKKRMEDREKLKALEKIQAERDKYQGIIEKLQAKYQPQQQEILELKKQIKEAEARAESAESGQVDVDSALEMATLDREMAEETAEMLRLELEGLKRRHEELELEVEILREENAELGKEMSPEDRTSQGWMQMERSNDRLREALLQLRDMTQDQEAELRQQISELEKDVQDLERFRNESVQLKDQLSRTEAIVDDLKQQLENALGAEDMIEEMADKNTALTEQIEELKSTIEDLESLRELSDELELNHTETEKQMQEEIDYHEALYLEQSRKAAEKEEKIEDLEYTVTRFRDLVSNMQSDLEEMRVSQEITETQANELTTRSRVMLDMNMKLQASALKSQVKAIEIELRTLDAQESAEHLAIAKLFMPDSYNRHKDSVDALLRLRRIGFKADLLYKFVKERVNGVASPGHEDNIFLACMTLSKLTWISSMCGRLTKFVYSSDLPAFEKLQAVLYDLEPVERSLNSSIDGLKRDDFNDKNCSAELSRSIAVMTHLAEAHLPDDDLFEFAGEVHMRAVVMQSNFESAASMVSHIKAITQAKILLPTDADEEDEEQAQDFLRRADALISQIRNAKLIASKAIQQLEELQTRSLCLNQSTTPTIDQTNSLCFELVSLSCKAGTSLSALVNSEAKEASITYEDVTRAIAPSDTIPFAMLSSKLSAATTQLQAFYNLTTTLSQTLEFIPPSSEPPWHLLAQETKAEVMNHVSREADINRLKDELHDKNTKLAMKDKILEEMSVSVEVLEKRVIESGSRKEKVLELQKFADTAKNREGELLRKLQTLEEQLRTAQHEHEDFKKQVAQAGTSVSTGETGEAQQQTAKSLKGAVVSGRTKEEIALLESEILQLRATIIYLRSSTHDFSMKKAATFLEAPLLAKSEPAAHELLRNEARDVSKSLLELIASPRSQMVQIHLRGKEDRLRWRPAKETIQAQLNAQKEQWEDWQDWLVDLSKKAKLLQSDRSRVGKAARKGDILARAKLRLPDIGWDKDVNSEVTIVNPSEWDGVERRLGIGMA